MTALAEPSGTGGIPAETPEIVLQINQCLRTGTLKDLKKIIENCKCKGIASADLVDKFGRTPLMVAAQHNKVSMLNYLLKNTDIPVNAGDSHGLTALHHCCRAGGKKNSTKAASVLMSSGASPKVEDHYGFTAFHQAVVFNQHEIVRNMIKRKLIDVNATTGDTKLRLNSPSYSSSSTSSAKDTALHIAARADNIFMVQQLLDLGANSSQQNSSGDTPLHDAVRGTNLAIVEILLANGASCTAVNEENLTPGQVCALTSIACARCRAAVKMN